MKILQLQFILLLLVLTQPVSGQGGHYTNRSNLAPACELFAKDAFQAADNFNRGVLLKDMLDLIQGAPVPESQKQRAFEAIQLVWNNQLDNPLMAYSLAMGLCLEPKQEMAPIAEPWLTSPRTSKEYF